MINQMFGGFPQLLPSCWAAKRMVIKSLNTAQIRKRCSAVVRSWEESPNFSLTLAKKAFFSWALNFRVRTLLKATGTAIALRRDTVFLDWRLRRNKRFERQIASKIRFQSIHFRFSIFQIYFTTPRCIPANFFWDIGVRFLSWECWDFWRRHDHFQRFPKKSQVLWRILKSSKNVRSPSPRLRTCINTSLLPLLFTSKIRDRKEGIVIYSFYTRFSFLTWVWVNMFLEIVSTEAKRQQLTFFNQAWEVGPQAWASVRSKFSTRRSKTHA